MNSDEAAQIIGMIVIAILIAITMWVITSVIALVIIMGLSTIFSEPIPLTDGAWIAGIFAVFYVIRILYGWMRDR